MINKKYITVMLTVFISFFACFSTVPSFIYGQADDTLLEEQKVGVNMQSNESAEESEATKEYIVGEVKNIEEVNITNTITTPLEEWYYREVGDAYVLNSYHGSQHEVIVPGEINGKQVKLAEDLSNRGAIFPEYVTSVVFKEVNGKKVQSYYDNEFKILRGNQNVITVDVSGFDSSKLEDASYMFEKCTSLKEVKGLDTWQMSKVKKAYSMFADCRSLTDLSFLKDFDVSNIQDIRSFFSGCRSLTTLKGLESWNLKSAERAKSMFSNCSSLVDLSALKDWDVSNINDFTSMFSGCKSLKSLKGIESWDIRNANDMSYFIANCETLVDVSAMSNWDLNGVNRLSNFFDRCISLESLDGLERWDTSTVTAMNFLFESCSSLKDIDAIKHWDVSNVEYFNRMFAFNKELSDVSAITNWQTSKVRSIEYMFYGCDSLKILDLSKWNLDSLTTWNQLFYTTQQTPILLIADQDILKQYDLKKDQRVPFEVTFNSNEGLFEDGASEHKIVLDYFMKDQSEQCIQQVIIDAKNRLEEEYKLPYKEYHHFVGWIEDVRNSGKPLQDLYYRLTSPMLANYQIDAYEVVFDSCGGSEVQSQMVDVFAKVNEPSVPTKAGYRFEGWYCDRDYTKSWDFENDVMEANNLTLYAKWSLKMNMMNHAPTIHASDRIVYVNDDFNPLEGVSASDLEDGRIVLSDVNIIENTVNMKKAGTYYIVFQVEDSQHAKVTKKINITVNERILALEQEASKPSIGQEPSNPTTSDSTNIKLMIVLLMASLGLCGLFLILKLSIK